MNKALFINGSPHKKGATAKTLNLIQAKIDSSHKTELIHAYDLQISPCLGCFNCRPDKKCILPKDDGHILGDKLKEADLLVLGTPSYWSNMPAPLKVIFDRNVSVLEYCLDKPPVPNMIGKKAIIAMTCASDESRSESDSQFPLLQSNLQYILGNSGYEIIGIIKASSSYDFEKNITNINEQIELIKMHSI
jgi:multimeric flavodoxin WrbA